MDQYIDTEGNPIATREDVVKATERSFASLKEERPDSPPEAWAILDATVAALRSLRDNPLIGDDSRVLMVMAKATFAATTAAGCINALYQSGLKAPVGKDKLN